MFIVCLDLEGVFTPEIWINVAMKTGIEELKLTTRDISDYEILMRRRLEILEDHGITLKDILKVIKDMALLPGAKDFMNWLQITTQVIVVTDSFIEFARLLMEKLGYAAYFCHHLETDERGMISNYILRIKDMKKITVKKFIEMNYQVIAVGDSYNDIGMLKEANYGILFRPPQNVLEEFPQFPVVNEYFELKQIISNHLGKTE